MNAQDALRWIAGQKAAEQRQLQEMSELGASPEFAIRAALDLTALAGRLQGWPLMENRQIKA